MGSGTPSRSWFVSPSGSRSRLRAFDTWLVSPLIRSPAVTEPFLSDSSAPQSDSRDLGPVQRNRQESNACQVSRTSSRVIEDAQGVMDEIEALKLRIEKTLKLQSDVSLECFEELKKKQRDIHKSVSGRLSRDSSEKDISRLYHECFGRKDLSEEMLDKHVCSILSLEEDSIIIERYSIPISVSDIRTLSARQWINDQIVNFYLNMIADCCGEIDKRVHLFSSFFYSKLTESGYTGVRRWTKRVDIFSKQLMLIPINISNMHWAMGAIDVSSQTIVYMDSLPSRKPKSFFVAIKSYLRSEWNDKKSSMSLNTPDFSGWKECIPDVPVQTNGYDCGMFAIHYALALVINNGIFTHMKQSEMDRLRKIVTYQISHGSLRCRVG